jgi:cytoskeletal protein CcmA (bactofilin family)
MEIPEYDTSNFINKILFKSGWKKSEFKKIVPNGEKSIVIEGRVFLENLSNISIQVNKRSVLIISNLENVEITGDQGSEIIIQNNLKGNIKTDGKVQLALRSYIVGNVTCVELMIRNDKNDKTKTPSIEGEMIMKSSIIK